MVGAGADIGVRGPQAAARRRGMGWAAKKKRKKARDALTARSAELDVLAPRLDAGGQSREVRVGRGKRDVDLGGLRLAGCEEPKQPIHWMASGPELIANGDSR